MEINSFRCLLGNMRTRELWGVTKGVHESVLRWFAYIERMGNKKIAERVNVGECMGSSLVG